MSINSVIRAALIDANFTVCELNIYTGTEDKYYTFNYDTSGANFGDDEPEHERALIQVHLVCPLVYNSLTQIKLTKQRLFALGCTWPEMTDASDEAGQHYIFECEFLAGADVSG